VEEDYKDNSFRVVNVSSLLCELHITYYGSVFIWIGRTAYKVIVILLNMKELFINRFYYPASF